jgi:uncharacterized protein (TIGR02217 family)
MTFLNIQFPITISYGSTGGPQYQTSVISMRSGQEKRNINWSYPRHIYDASTGIKRIADLEDVIGFFHIVQGMGYSFRWKDWADFKSCKTGNTPTATDQALGTGDGSEDEFQIYKTYTVGSYSRQSRKITKPVEGTVLVAIDGEATTAFSVDTSTGVITFDTNSWSVVAGSTLDDWIAVSGNKTSTIADGDNFEITGSTGNDGIYTVASVEYEAGFNRTKINVTGSIESAVVDGNVIHGQPNDGAVLTCGFEFDVHARFDTDELSTNYAHYEAGMVDVPIVELKRIES